MEENALMELTLEEARVLGSLIEKSRATPEYYPMTLNSLKSACNQKSSRNPVVDYDEETILQALDTLRKKGLVSTVVGGGSRVSKYKHNLMLAFSLNPEDAAVLCLLLLRGPLTAGEINANSGRLFEFENLNEINEVLLKLSESNPAFIKQIGKRPGQKERRYIQMFSPYNEDLDEVPTVKPALAAEGMDALLARVEYLEIAYERLKQEFDQLMQELG